MRTIKHLILPVTLIALAVSIYCFSSNKDLCLYSMTFMRQDQLSTANQLVSDLATADLETGISIELKATGFAAE
jgi:hypothetical protein